MPESQSVQELMFDGGDAVAVITDGQPLPPDALVAHRGETASRTQGKHSLFKSQIEGGEKKKTSSNLEDHTVLLPYLK